MSKMSNKPIMFYCQECGHPIEGGEEDIDMVLNSDGELVCDACESYVNLATARQRDADVEATTELIELGKRKEHDMSKMKQLDLHRQEVVTQCDEMRWENEGVGLSDVQRAIVEYAFMQGMAYAPDTQQPEEEIPKLNSLQVTIEEIARVALGMVFDEIGHELDLSDDTLLEVRDYLESKLDEAVDAEVGEYVDTHQTKEKK